MGVQVPPLALASSSEQQADDESRSEVRAIEADHLALVGARENPLRSDADSDDKTPSRTLIPVVIHQHSERWRAKLSARRRIRHGRGLLGELTVEPCVASAQAH